MRKRHADGSARCSTAPASKSNAGFVICRPRSPHAAGAGPLHVTICAEYDCLLAIGHACGHNVIAAMAAGAGIALAKVANDAGLTVTVLGTPAEEICNAGGKILLLERGEFAGTHFAMMAHPAPVDMAVPPFLPVRGQVHRQGGARFGVSPGLGINAADALVIAQSSIGPLRQHIHPTDRIHGIVTRRRSAKHSARTHLRELHGAGPHRR